MKCRREKEKRQLISQACEGTKMEVKPKRKRNEMGSGFEPIVRLSSGKIVPDFSQILGSKSL